MGVYSLVLLACDALLTVAWHVATRKLISRSNPAYRIRSLSPSVRFSIGFLFGVARLWVISHISPTPLYYLISRSSFALGLALGLAALVFDDGPWRSLRPHNHSAVDHKSPLNPMRLLKPDFIADARPGKWRVSGLRRRLEAHPGRPVSLLLDGRGDIVLTESGRIQVRIAADLLQNAPERRLVELVASVSRCRSGNKTIVRWRPPFAGVVRGSLFDRRLNVGQRAALCELLCELNEVGSGNSAALARQENSREASSGGGVAEAMRRGGGGGVGGEEDGSVQPPVRFNLAMFRRSAQDETEEEEERAEADRWETEENLEEGELMREEDEEADEESGALFSLALGGGEEGRRFDGIRRRRRHRHPGRRGGGVSLGTREEDYEGGGDSSPPATSPIRTTPAARKTGRTRADSPSSVTGLEEFLLM